MAVPASERKNSKIQYLYNAMEFSNQIYDILPKMPSKWREYRQHNFVNTIDKLLEFAATADAIKPTNRKEKDKKVFLLQEALGQANCLEIYIDDILMRWLKESQAWEEYQNQVKEDKEKPGRAKPSILKIKESHFLNLADFCKETKDSLIEAIKYNKN